MFAALVTLACAFTPNLAPLAQHVAPRAVVQQHRIAAQPTMRGWDDPFSGDAARGDNKREKLQVVRPHVSNHAPLAHRTLPSFWTDQPRTPPALVNMRLCSLPSANTRFFPFPLRSCQALNDCARSTMRTASSTISLGCIPLDIAGKDRL